jgi:threonine synthase
MQSPSLICSVCARRHAVSTTLWRCHCGGLLDLDYEPRFDRDAIRSGLDTLWRYRSAIPLPEEYPIVSLGEGFTPLRPIEIDGRSVQIKHDHLCPTGSYKDRGASVLISLAAGLGVAKLIEDSSGNAGAAIAAYASRAGLTARILVPETTSEDKLALIAATGAQLDRIPGNREDTANAARTAAAHTFYASHCWNPYFLHGTKTVAYEICEQLGWKAPDSVVLPVGHGSLLLGAAIGFSELRTAGIIPRLPRLIAVQAAACNPLARAFRSGRDQPDAPGSFTRSDTMADGIAIAQPVRGHQILAAVRKSQGTFISVTEGEMAQAHRMMIDQGHSIEPTSAATVAGLRTYLSTRGKQDSCIVSVFTGQIPKPVENLTRRQTRRPPDA